MYVCSAYFSVHKFQKICASSKKYENFDIRMHSNLVNVFSLQEYKYIFHLFNLFRTTFYIQEFNGTISFFHEKPVSISYTTHQ